MEDYTAKDIVVLEGLKAVRKRPAMYIGSTDVRGLHQLLYEVLDNSVDEAMGGYCKNIFVTVKGKTVTIEDDGRGIPVDIHPKYNKSALEIVLTELHSGAKFEQKVYKVSGGLHGVGVHVVNALSSSFEIFVKRGGFVYHQGYSKGDKLTPVEKVGKIEDGKISWIRAINTNFHFNSPTGTLISFEPDETIMETAEYTLETVKGRIEELSYLNKGLAITLDWNGNIVTYQHEGGIEEMVKNMNKGKKTLHDEIIYGQIKFNGEMKDISNGNSKNSKEDSDSSQPSTYIEFAIQYNETVGENLLAFANDINTREGGTHVSGFKAALTKVLNDEAKRQDIIKEENYFTGEDVREGLTAVISVKIPEPQFEGQTKEKLGNSNVKGMVFSGVAEHLKRYFEDHPRVSEIICKKAYQAAEAREAARNAREMVRSKSTLSATLPGKLADCTLEDPEKTELYVVEGDSAAGPAKQGRDRSFQAILPLRGKILNVEKAAWDKILKNNEVKNLFAAINMGPNDPYDPKKLRYGKIIFMTDADVDGSHIRTLLLTLFYRHLKELLVNGHVYIAVVPLFRIQKGTVVKYVYTEREKDALIKQMSNPIVQRFKGLGEMNPDQLWDTAMNPETRKLVRVQIEDAQEADALFTLLMGEEVQPRKDYIMSHATEAQNIDV
ncbi:MAG: DNA gyrase/topoisomerase IV subunit B [Thermoplasmata archaeon]